MVDDHTTPMEKSIRSEAGETGGKDVPKSGSFGDLIRTINAVEYPDQYFFDSLGLRFKEYLGTGGQALVSLAEQADGTPVTLKISLQSLQNEAENMDLVHQNGAFVPELYGFGNYPNDIYYLEMGYIQQQHLIPGQMDIDAVLRIGIDVAKTLAVAHNHGITHNDVKPGNIRYGLDDKAYLIDWGISELRGVEKSKQDSKKFHSTLGYTAPERFDESHPERFGCSDQFSLGAALYSYLTGSSPYNRGDLKDSTRVETARRYLERVRTEDRPALVSQLSLDDKQPQRLKTLDSVIARMLNPRPLKRYSSCMEVAYVLSTILDSK